MAEGDEPTAVERALTLKERFDRSHPGRMLARVSEHNGNVLAGGIAYFSLTSIAAGLVIAVTLSSYLLHANAAWNDAFYGFLDEFIPGVVSTDGGAGLVDPDSLAPQTLTGVVGLVSFLVLFNTATRYLGGLRMGVQTMLGDASTAPDKGGKVRDFIMLFAIGLIVIVGVVIQVLASRAAGVVADWIAVETLSEWAIRAPALAVGLLVDMAFVLLAFVVLGGYRTPRRALWWTVLVTAAGISLLRMGVSLVVGSTAENPVLGSFAAIITIMIFVDFLARIMLYGAAWLGAMPRVDEGAPQVGELDTPARRERGTVTTTRATGVKE